MRIEISDKEFDAVVAALRNLEADMGSGKVSNEDQHIGDLLTNGGKHEGLTIDEIDALCMDLNLGERSCV